jgi:hypothetical protein
MILLACARTAGSPSTSVERPSTPPERLAATQHFVFWSDRWVSLHHFLYGLARVEAGIKPYAEIDDGGRSSTLAEPRRSAWKAAVAYYRENLASRSLLFDPAMLEARVVLSTGRGPEGLDPAHARALTAAMPVYESTWWKDHDRAGRDWLAALKPLLARHESKVAERIAAAYESAWPTEPLRVDLVPYADWPGAYTVNEPTFVTIAGGDPRHQGQAALEILFHESSHDPAFEGRLRAAIDRAFGPSRPPPEILWHAIIFFTAGDIVGDALAEAGQPRYVPYVERRGFFRRPDWKPLQPLLEEPWRQHLAGKIPLDEALTAFARALPAEPAGAEQPGLRDTPS